MASPDQPKTMPGIVEVGDSQDPEPAMAVQVDAPEESSSWECLSSPEHSERPENPESLEPHSHEMAEDGGVVSEIQDPVANEDIVLIVNDHGDKQFESDVKEHHHHEHHHVHVRKTILKDNGHHVHLNRSKRVYVTEIHHHHHIHIKHIHIYDKSGNAWYSRLATSSDESSRSDGSLPASQSQSSEARSDVSDSQ
eukprot:s2243_g3.t1